MQHMCIWIRDYLLKCSLHQAWTFYQLERPHEMVILLTVPRLRRAQQCASEQRQRH